MINPIWIDNLIKVFEYENKLYVQILKAAGKKTGIIVKGELKELQELVGKEEKLISELNKLSDVREQIIAQIAKSVGKKPEELTVTYLIDLLPKESAKRLALATDKLKKTIEKLTAKNTLNQKLLSNALEYVDFSLNLLTQPAPEAAQYGNKGKETGTKSRNVLDIKY